MLRARRAVGVRRLVRLSQSSDDAPSPFFGNSREKTKSYDTSGLGTSLFHLQRRTRGARQSGQEYRSVSDQLLFYSN
jgi:hypothetical protein